MPTHTHVARLLRWAALVVASSMAIAAALLTTPTLRTADAADPGETIFQSKCAGCHTIGGGRTVGPDLRDITKQRDRAWLIEMITVPDQLIARKDPVVVDLMKEYPIPMPNLGISRSDAEAILAYIDARSAGGAAPAAPPKVPAGAGDAAIGRALFSGQRPLSAGGPACSTCHSAGGPSPVEGGTLGPDLTQLYTRLGDAGTAAALASLPFPTMMPVYAGRPLSPDEQANLKAFLQETSTAGGQATDTLQYAAYALVGAVVLFGLVHLLWRQRLGGVHRPFIGRVSRS